MANGVSISYILIAIATGVIPTLVWLYFWIREDRFQPEPRGLLTLTFMAGAVSSLLLLPLDGVIIGLGIEGNAKIFTFAALEELLKFGVVFLIDFNSSYLDEPIDYAIYLITGALGFATAENVLFLLRPETQENISFIIETGTLRFLGASILHSVLAASLGIILGFVFYKSQATKRLFTIIGLIVVTILHTIFNYFIIKYVQINGFLTLAILWVVAIFIIAMMERVRNINH